MLSRNSNATENDLVRALLCLPLGESIVGIQLSYIGCLSQSMGGYNHVVISLALETDDRLYKIFTNIICGCKSPKEPRVVTTIFLRIILARSTSIRWCWPGLCLAYGRLTPTAKASQIDNRPNNRFISIGKLILSQIPNLYPPNLI
jgi:hypothetical protein